MDDKISKSEISPLVTDQSPKENTIISAIKNSAHSQKYPGVTINMFFREKQIGDLQNGKEAYLPKSSTSSKVSSFFRVSLFIMTFLLFATTGFSLG